MLRTTAANTTAMMLLCTLVPLMHLRGQPAWRVDPRPVTVIEDDGTPETQWRSLAGAVVLGSGDVLVADAVGEVRRFSRLGRYVERIMRSGNGPRELPRIMAFMPWHDGAVAVTDREYLTFAVTDPHKGSVPAGGGPPSGLLAALLQDESLVAVQMGFKVIAPPTRVLRDSASLVLRLPDGNSRRLGRVPYSTALVLEVPAAPGGLRYGVLEGAPQLLVAARDSVVWFGSTDSPGLTRVSIAGSAARSINVTGAGTPVAWTTARLDAWKRWAVARASSGPDSLLADARWSKQHLPANVPLFRSAIPDVGGGLWLERFPALPTDAPEFLVLSPSGTTIARVHLPRAARLLSVQRATVTVAERDENDVERVVVYAVQR